MFAKRKKQSWNWNGKFATTEARREGETGHPGHLIRFQLRQERRTGEPERAFPLNTTGGFPKVLLHHEGRRQKDLSIGSGSGKGARRENRNECAF